MHHGTINLMFQNGFKYLRACFSKLNKQPACWSSLDGKRKIQEKNVEGITFINIVWIILTL